MEDFYILHEDDYRHDKPRSSHDVMCIVTNCSIPSVTLHIAGIGTPNRKHTAAAKKEPTEPIWVQHCIVIMHF